MLYTGEVTFEHILTTRDLEITITATVEGSTGHVTYDPDDSSEPYAEVTITQVLRSDDNSPVLLLTEEEYDEIQDAAESQNFDVKAMNFDDCPVIDDSDIPF